MASIYTTAFILGFFTSFGWWTAGKVQKGIDNTVVNIKVEVKEEK
jgi:hypothetical protein